MFRLGLSVVAATRNTTPKMTEHSAGALTRAVFPVLANASQQVPGRDGF